MLNNSFSTIDFLKKATDGTWLRHLAITNNIANANTPGYKKITVEFEDILKQKLTKNRVTMITTDEKHISGKGSLKDFKPVIKREKSYSTRRDGNNVNVDIENAELAKNTIMYNTLITQISNEFRKVKTVISEGGK